jgi:hypothetical protein
VQQEFVALLARRFAVVPRHADLHVRRHDVRPYALESRERRLDDLHRVRALAFGHRQRHRGPAAVPCGRRLTGRRRARSESNVTRGLLAPVGDGGHVAQKDRASFGGADDDRADVLEGAQHRPRFDEDRAVVPGERPGSEPAVVCLQRTDDPERCDAARREALRVELDADLSTFATDEGDVADVGHLFDALAQLRGDSAQLEGFEAITPQRQGKHGHVVDGARFDEGLGDPRRHAVEVRAQLVVQAHERVLFVATDLESHNGGAHAGHARRIQILDARNLPQQLLHRARDAGLDLFGGRPRHADENVDHGDDDLGLFFPGELLGGEHTERDGREHEERRQFRMHESRGDLAGGPLRGGAVRVLTHGFALPAAAETEMGRASASWAMAFGSATTTFSPASSPESTSTSSP